MLCALQTDKNQECSKRVYATGWKDLALQSLLNDPCFEYFEAVGLISDTLDSPSISPEAPRSPTNMLFGIKNSSSSTGMRKPPFSVVLFPEDSFEFRSILYYG